ncbi:ATP phosphoribosyltransferase regulatory subunit [Deinococcus maricopensis]|uniref:ATP phosphoribosyltransferase regulatory subunit n=1 Tax=Deinococcus maricopensis (strain DSM 21211 / LMG 22137 / NRRL B-23946 / LB-34) TaxID=709986 RepID=E8U9Q2_DEIML|nr:ATP phosphoribosyltransferase regulatory subunit [Deinococcus maricopensis]ADV67791.1 ATP phosphoribosyltransferase regulatory subunit [Deinococcus maricopensis DSM 21211]
MLTPDGTRDVLPPEWAWREHLRSRLHAYFGAFGYQGVELPALEFQDHAHPQDARAFKLIDRDGRVLALRSEFTTAVLRLVRSRFPDGPFPLRLQYGGRLWLRAQASELGRLREFAQVGAELVGVDTPHADAELLLVAGGALKDLGVRARLEVGHPGFVDATLEDAGITGEAREALHAALDRKSGPDVARLARLHGLSADVQRVLNALPDLYGGAEVLADARRLAHGERARAAVERLTRIADLYGDDTLLFDLGMSRRYGYYSGFTFRAYADGVNRQILGGGRYHDAAHGTGLAGAGFAVGLERLTEVAARLMPPPVETVLAYDAHGAAFAHAQGLTVELAWTEDPLALARYARARGIRRVVRGQHLEFLEVQA